MILHQSYIAKLCSDLCLCLIHNRLKVFREAWIGLTKEHNDCEDIACRRQGWMWADKTTYSFQNWTSDEPAKDRFYAYVRLPNPGWIGAKSTTKKPFVCEYGNKQNPST